MGRQKKGSYIEIIVLALPGSLGLVAEALRGKGFEGLQLLVCTSKENEQVMFTSGFRENTV